MKNEEFAAAFPMVLPQMKGGSKFFVLHSSLFVLHYINSSFFIKT